MLRKCFDVLLLLLIPSFSFSQYFGEEITQPSSWSVGIKVSTSQLSSDISPLGYGKQGGFFFEKNLGKVFDLRIEAQIGQNRGLNLFLSDKHYLNNSLNGSQNPEISYDSTSRYFHNYQHSYGSLGVHLKINLNRLVMVLGAEKWDLYLLSGFGAYGYESKINALDKWGKPYIFPSVDYLNDELALNRLENLLDDSFESLAEQDPLNSTFAGPFVLKTYFIAGGGIRLQLTKKIGLGTELSYLFFGDDLLDGQQWDEDGNMSTNRDKLMSLGLLLDLAF